MYIAHLHILIDQILSVTECEAINYTTGIFAQCNIRQNAEINFMFYGLLSTITNAVRIRH